MDTVKKQHYVWRKYIAEWADIKDTDKGNVFVLRKTPQGKQPKIGISNLKDIAFEKYFYDVSKYSQDDINIFIKLLSIINEKTILKDLNISISNAFINDEARSRDYIEKNIICESEDLDSKWKFRDKLMSLDISFYKDSVAQETINKLKNSLILSLLGFDIQTQISLEDIKKIIFELPNENDLKYDFNRFFWMQHFRSKIVHVDIEKCIDEVKKDIPNFSNLDRDFFTNMLCVYSSFIVALNITQNFESYLIVIENNTKIPFVTSDSPIISINDTHHNGTSTFYYPLSPKIAIELLVETSRFNATHINEIQTVNDNKTIEQYNQAMIDGCYNEIYSNDEDFLKELEQNLNY